MSVEGVNPNSSPLVMTQRFAAEASRDVERVAASHGTQQLLARANNTSPAVERRAMEQANERNALTTYDYDPATRTVGAATTSGDRVGMFLNTLA